VNGSEAVALLLDTELTPGQQNILAAVWDVFLVGWNDDDGHHRAVVPKSRYVLQQTRRASVDLEAEHTRLPWAPTRHGSFGLLIPTVDRLGVLDPTNDWSVTLAGVVRMEPDHPLVTAVVDFVRAAAAQAAWVTVRPWDVDQIEIGEELLLKQCGFDTERWIPYLQQVFGTLGPLAGLRRIERDDLGSWTVPDGIDAFADCSTAREVLTRALDLIRPLPGPVTMVPLAPAALAEALDHLDAVWYRAFGQGLFARQGVDLSTAARISLPVETLEDLKLARIDLGNVIARWQPLRGWQRPSTTTGGSRAVCGADVAASVAAKHPQIDHDGLLAALQALEGPVLLRNGTTHTNSQGRVLDGHAVLGVDPNAAPGAQWGRICRSVIAAAAEARSVINVT
jgi:hypothetical protein